MCERSVELTKRLCRSVDLNNPHLDDWFYPFANEVARIAAELESKIEAGDAFREQILNEPDDRLKWYADRCERLEIANQSLQQDLINTKEATVRLQREQNGLPCSTCEMLREQLADARQVIANQEQIVGVTKDIEHELRRKNYNQAERIRSDTEQIADLKSQIQQLECDVGDRCNTIGEQQATIRNAIEELTRLRGLLVDYRDRVVELSDGLADCCRDMRNEFGGRS